MDELIKWLLEGPPWVRYRTRIDLLGEGEGDPNVQRDRRKMLNHYKTRELLDELSNWPGRGLKNHRDASHPLHKLTFVADLGFKEDDPPIGKIIQSILRHRSREGPLQVLMNLHPRYGGTGKDQWVWMLCDAPLILYALLKFGLSEDRRVEDALDHLMGLIHENGWPCATSSNLQGFRGPGRKEDPCPYATLVMLKALAQTPHLRESEPSRIGAETLLNLWEQRRERRPYLFAMGRDFAKLKVPLVWYDILHVLDVLTQFPWLKGDIRLKGMVALVEAKADEKGRFKPESVWRAWKDWEFGQKRAPSRWLTLVVRRLLKRVEEP